MTEDLEKILNKFISNFKQWYIFTSEFIGEEKRGVWIDTLSIFYALENCKSTVRKNSVCRFSKGAFQKKDLNKLSHHLTNRRALLKKRGNRSKVNFVKKARKELSEFMVDFSISNYRIPDAYSSDDGGRNSREKFEFLLIAESELTSKITEISRDCLKLTQVSASYKIMFFRTGGETKAKNRKNEFERLLTNALKDDDDAEWLFIGIPSYAEWESKSKKLEKPPVILFTIADSISKKGSVVLEDISRMWKW